MFDDHVYCTVMFCGALVCIVGMAILGSKADAQDASDLHRMDLELDEARVQRDCAIRAKDKALSLSRYAQGKLDKLRARHKKASIRVRDLMRRAEEAERRVASLESTLKAFGSGLEVAGPGARKAWANCLALLAILEGEFHDKPWLRGGK